MLAGEEDGVGTLVEDGQGVVGLAVTQLHMELMEVTASRAVAIPQASTTQPTADA
jgi:hypothetical protein